jgi:hypothetical protein
MGVFHGPVATTTCRTDQVSWSVTTRKPRSPAVTDVTVVSVRTGAPNDPAYPSRCRTHSPTGMKPSASGPVYREPGSLVIQRGVSRCSESQRSVRQRSPTRPRSSTTWSRPASVSRLLTASPAWPAPMTRVSVVGMMSFLLLLGGQRVTTSTVTGVGLVITS